MRQLLLQALPRSLRPACLLPGTQRSPVSTARLTSQPLQLPPQVPPLLQLLLSPERSQTTLPQRLRPPQQQPHQRCLNRHPHLQQTLPQRSDCLITPGVSMSRRGIGEAAPISGSQSSGPGSLNAQWLPRPAILRGCFSGNGGRLPCWIGRRAVRLAVWGEREPLTTP